MAAKRGRTGPLADDIETAESVKKTQAAAAELVGGSNRDTEKKKQKKTVAAAAAGDASRALPAAPITKTPPLPSHCQPIHMSGKRRRMFKLPVKRSSWKSSYSGEPQGPGYC